jgi:hypothetical protein
VSPAWFGCTDRARFRDDPLIGTAPHAHGWLLIEHRGPWGVEALAESGIDHHVLTSLSTAARQANWRILLIRRPGRQVDSDRRRWLAIGPLNAVGGDWRVDADLLTAAAVTRRLAQRTRTEPLEGTDGSTQPERHASPVATAEPVILVCTHGTHDTCCAVRGRPVAAALAARWPEAVWECSHLGGDRFAANVVVLPDAAYYGNLDADSAVGVVASHLAGRLAIDRLRGLARYPPVAQVAIAEAHRRLGPMGATAITAGEAEQVEPHRWRVQVQAPGSRWLAEVVAERRRPAVLTCRAATATPATAYLVTTFLPVPSPETSQSGTATVQ